MIRCTGLEKHFGSHTALQPLDLQVEGGVCALLGPNGAGKSTLLRLLCGLERPSDGAACVAGFDVARNETAFRRSIGVLPEQLGLFEPLGLFENLLTTGPVYGLSRAETRSRAESLFLLLDLAAARETPAAKASYGMRKKTALALALLHNPRVLLLDEPFEGIDPTATLAIGQLLADAGRRGTTVLFTSHTLRVVERIATRTLILRASAVAWDSAAQPAASASLQQTYEAISPRAFSEIPAWLGC